MPINLNTLDLIDEIDDVIDRTDNRRVADLINQPSERFLTWVKGRPRDVYLDGVDRALDIAKVWRKADKLIGLSQAWQRRLTPCPKCELPTLGMFSGSSSVQCSNCGETMTYDEYAAITLVKAERERNTN